MKLRRDFLNWRPDLEDFGSDHLTVADNMLHSDEGWKQITLQTQGSVSTANGLASITLTALQARPMGARRDLATSGQNNYMLGVIAHATTTALQEGVHFVENPGGELSTAQSLFSQGATSQAIVAFDSCELNDNVFVCAFGVAEATTTSLQTISNHAATMTIVE